MRALLTVVASLLIASGATAASVAQSIHPQFELSNLDRTVVAGALESLETDAFDLLLDSTMPVCQPGTETTCIGRAMFETVKFSAWQRLGGTAFRNTFLMRNRRPIPLGMLKVTVPMVNALRVRNRSATWPRAFSEHPGACHFVQVSAPLFTMDGDNAVIYVESVRQDGHRAGFLQLLHRKRGRWLVERTLSTWTADGSSPGTVHP